MKKRVIVTVLNLCLLGFTFPVYAESWFQVEVIVFEYTRPDTDGESWYTNPGLPAYQNSIKLVQGLPPVRDVNGKTADARSENGAAEDNEVKTGPHRTAYLKLPQEYQNLEGIYRVLDVTGEYRPLYHTVWQQPGLEAKEARYVHIEGLRETNGENETVTEISNENRDSVGLEREPGSVSATQEMSFDGMIRLRSSHFLHLDVDAAYFPPDTAVLQSRAALEQELPAYQFADYVRLQESRRIRLKELHYFDHPLFGVIVQVTRIEEKEGE